MNTMNELLQELIQLPEDQRLAFAHRLLAVNESHDLAEVASEWDSEICSRIAGYDRGELRSRSLEEVFSALDRQIKV